MSARKKAVPWPDLYRAQFRPSFSKEEAETWELEIIQHYPDVIESDIEAAVRYLFRIRDRFKYSPGVADLKDAVGDVLNRKRLSAQKGELPEGCPYCQDTGWMSYAYEVMPSGKEVFSEATLSELEYRGEMLTCADYPGAFTKSVPCECLAGSIHHAGWRREALQSIQEKVKHWKRSQPECSKFHPEAKVYKGRRQSPQETKQGLLDLTQGITEKSQNAMDQT